MARARPTAPSVSLFPFMSILACLVGTIVVMICVLSVIQAQNMGGRPRQEVRDAANYVKAREETDELKAEIKKIENERTEKDAEAMRVMQETKELEDKVIKLRLQAEAAKQGEQANRELQHQLEMLKLQMQSMEKEKPNYATEIEQLKAELASRKKSPEELAAPIVVKPGGTGKAAGKNLYFVETTAGAITLFVTKSERKRISEGSVGKDAEYDAFLQRVADTKEATLVFLIRDDGWSAYTRAAGWAEGKFGVRTGKLPMPGKGAIDLTVFEEFMAP